jgi:redox-sensitive bicupin YhaK (pirin superfamily)
VASLAGRQIGQDFAGKDGWNMYHGERVPGFPQHPHRGFETVTVVRRGLVDHSDSLGAQARYGEGDVQWLTAGAGIQHAEMFPLVHRDRDNPLELFQIWLNLPAADKMAPPHFKMFWADAVPSVSPAGGVSVTLVAGALGGVAPPAPPPHSYASRAESDVAIWTIRLDAGASWALPPAAAGSNRFLYFFAGRSLRVSGTPVPEPALVVVDGSETVRLEAAESPVEILLLQGRPIVEPVAQYGPFVMNTRAELQQAFADYQRTQFGGWPWGAADPVNAREGRFARRPDGSVERPAAAASPSD